MPCHCQRRWHGIDLMLVKGLKVIVVSLRVHLDRFVRQVTRNSTTMCCDLRPVDCYHQTRIDRCWGAACKPINPRVFKPRVKLFEHCRVIYVSNDYVLKSIYFFAISAQYVNLTCNKSWFVIKYLAMENMAEVHSVPTQQTQNVESMLV